MSHAARNRKKTRKHTRSRKPLSRKKKVSRSSHARAAQSRHQAQVTGVTKLLTADRQGPEYAAAVRCQQLCLGRQFHEAANAAPRDKAAPPSRRPQAGRLLLGELLAVPLLCAGAWPYTALHVRQSDQQTLLMHSGALYHSPAYVDGDVIVVLPDQGMPEVELPHDMCAPLAVPDRFRYSQEESMLTSICNLASYIPRGTQSKGLHSRMTTAVSTP